MSSRRGSWAEPLHPWIHRRRADPWFPFGTINRLHPSGTSALSWRERIIAWLRWIVLIGIGLIALSAPLANRTAAGISRVAVFVWLLLLIVSRFKVHKQTLAAPLLTFLFLLALSSSFSVDPQLSWDRMLTYSLATIALMAGQMIETRRTARRVVLLLLLGTLVSVGVSLWRQITERGVVVLAVPAQSAAERAGLLPGDVVENIDGIRVREPEDWFHAARALPGGRQTTLQVRRRLLESGAPSRKITVAIDREGLEQSHLLAANAPLQRSAPPRAEGFFHHYFPYAEFLALVVPLAFALFVEARPKLRKALWSICFLLLGTALVLTLTRIALLAGLLACLVIAARQLRKHWTWIGAAALAVLAAGAWWVGMHRGIALLDATDAGTQYRLLMWRDGLRMVPHHPWLGIGLNCATGHWQWWNFEAYRRFPLHSHFHSTWIQLAVEAGIPALAAWVWMLWSCHAFLLRLMRKLQAAAPFDRALAAGIYAGFLGSVLISLVQYNWGDPEVMVVFWLLMGIAIALDRAAATTFAASAGGPPEPHPVC